MPSNRMQRIEDARRDAETRSLSKYYYVDIDKLERLGITQYKLTEGSHFLAIIPPPHAEMMWCREVFIHQEVGVNRLTFLCPKQICDALTGKKLNEDCPICNDLIKILERNPADERKDAYRASRRFLFFIVDVSDLTLKSTEAQMLKKKVQWLDAPATIRDGITAACKDKRTKTIKVDISDPDNGKTVIFDRIGKGLGNTKYEGFELEDRKPVPDAWLEVPLYDEILKISTFDDIAAEHTGISHDDPGEPTEGCSRRAQRQPDVVGENDSPDTPRSRRRASQEAKPVEEESKPTTKKTEPQEEEVKPAAEPATSRSRGDGDAPVDRIASVRERLRQKQEQNK